MGLVQQQFLVFFRINYINMTCMEKYGGWRFAVLAIFALVSIMALGLTIGHAAFHTSHDAGTSALMIISSVMIGGLSALGAEAVYTKQKEIDNLQPNAAANNGQWNAAVGNNGGIWYNNGRRLSDLL